MAEENQPTELPPGGPQEGDVLTRLITIAIVAGTIAILVYSVFFGGSSMLFLFR